VAASRLWPGELAGEQDPPTAEETPYDLLAWTGDEQRNQERDPGHDKRQGLADRDLGCLNPCSCRRSGWPGPWLNYERQGQHGAPFDAVEEPVIARAATASIPIATA
jgi:hypothetical protein